MFSSNYPIKQTISPGLGRALSDYYLHNIHIGTTQLFATRHFYRIFITKKTTCQISGPECKAPGKNQEGKNPKILRNYHKLWFRDIPNVSNQ